MPERGKYIVIEGHDGTGKSTQVDRLEKHLAKLGLTCNQIHEPDGVPAASKLRDIIKDGRLERDPWTNVMLFTTARRLNWVQQIQPSIERGHYLVAARSWISTAIYQGYGQGVPLEKIEEFTRENIAPEYLNPDLSLILTMNDDKLRTDRIANRGELERPDTFESMPHDFQTRVHEGYVDFAKKRGIEVIDASQDIEEVEKVIWDRVQNLVQ